MKESKLQRDIREALELEFGGFFFKTHGSMFQIAGLPDLVGVSHGCFIGVEVKVPGKDPSNQQKVILRMIKRAGGIACVARSPDTAIRRVRRGLIKHYEKIIEDPTIQLPKKSSKERSKKKTVRSVYGDGHGEDSHYATNPRKIIPKRKP